jgi:hypothetical protein
MDVSECCGDAKGRGHEREVRALRLAQAMLDGEVDMEGGELKGVGNGANGAKGSGACKHEKEALDAKVAEEAESGVLLWLPLAFSTLLDAQHTAIHANCYPAWVRSGAARIFTGVTLWFVS